MVGYNSVSYWNLFHLVVIPWIFQKKKHLIKAGNLFPCLNFVLLFAIGVCSVCLLDVQNLCKIFLCKTYWFLKKKNFIFFLCQLWNGHWKQKNISFQIFKDYHHKEFHSSMFRKFYFANECLNHHWNVSGLVWKFLFKILSESLRK